MAADAEIVCTIKLQFDETYCVDIDLIYLTI